MSRAGHIREALDPGREAVGIWRQLAATDTDRFGPELASALNNMGAMMDEAGTSDEAISAFEQAICQLAPHFQADPITHRAAMSAMLKNYMERTEELGLEPDGGLVQPILDILIGPDRR